MSGDFLILFVSFLIFVFAIEINGQKMIDRDILILIHNRVKIMIDYCSLIAREHIYYVLT